MTNFNNLNNEEAKQVIIAILKGITHATVAPFIIMLMINLSTDGNFGGVMALIYIAITATVYNFFLKDEDIAKYAFNFTATTVIAFPLGILFIGFLGAMFN